MDTSEKIRAAKNRTIVLDDQQIENYSANLMNIKSPVLFEQILNRILNQRIEDAVSYLPNEFIDLAFIDPPYNLDKDFNGSKFKKLNNSDYVEYVEGFLQSLIRCLKPSASVYICCDWRCCGAVEIAAQKFLKFRNRITWEREKGRGALKNWKNCSEDILFFTVSNDYTFNCDAVKMKRRVIAPYKIDGKPKDWLEDNDGGFRLTSPSNLWTDLTVPFWSMTENTDHPTQKPEKLLAKIILASSNPGDVVFDPFAGSGTTAATAKKLDRNFVCVEVDKTYCCLAQKRLELAENDKTIQGYEEGVFWERNSKK